MTVIAPRRRSYIMPSKRLEINSFLQTSGLHLALMSHARSHMWQEVVGTPLNTPAVNDGDPVGLVDEASIGSSHRIIAPSTGTRPTLINTTGGIGSAFYFNSANNSRFFAENSEYDYSEPWKKQQFDWYMKLAVTVDGTAIALAPDTDNFQGGATHNGWFIYRESNNKVWVYITTSSANILNGLVSVNSLTVASGAVGIRAWGDGSKWRLRVGSGTTPVEANYAGTAGTGKGFADAYFGSQSAGGSYGNFKLLFAFYKAGGNFTADEIAFLDAYNPAPTTGPLNITGATTIAAMNFVRQLYNCWDTNYLYSDTGNVPTTTISGSQGESVKHVVDARGCPYTNRGLVAPANRLPTWDDGGGADATGGSLGSLIFDGSTTKVGNNTASQFNIAVAGATSALSAGTAINSVNNGAREIHMGVRCVEDEGSGSEKGSHILFGSDYLAVTSYNYPNADPGIGLHHPYAIIHGPGAAAFPLALLRNINDGCNVISLRQRGPYIWMYCNGYPDSNNPYYLPTGFFYSAIGPCVNPGWWFNGYLFGLCERNTYSDRNDFAVIVNAVAAMGDGITDINPDM